MLDQYTKFLNNGIKAIVKSVLVFQRLVVVMDCIGCWKLSIELPTVGDLKLRSYQLSKLDFWFDDTVPCCDHAFLSIGHREGVVV